MHSKVDYHARAWNFFKIILLCLLRAELNNLRNSTSHRPCGLGVGMEVGEGGWGWFICFCCGCVRKTEGWESDRHNSMLLPVTYLCHVVFAAFPPPLLLSPLSPSYSTSLFPTVRHSPLHSYHSLLNPHLPLPLPFLSLPLLPPPPLDTYTHTCSSCMGCAPICPCRQTAKSISRS